MTKIQKIAGVYAFFFVAVVVSGHVPGLSPNGLLFGSFKIDFRDDVLHLLSGLWAGYAAWKSVEASRFYFRAFGFFYTMDALLGLFTGYAFNDLVVGDFAANHAFHFANFTNNLMVNLPHFVIGPLALLIGLVFNKKLETKN